MVAPILAILLLRSAQPFGTGVPFILSYPTVVVVAWYGGLGPGLLATAVTIAFTLELALLSLSEPLVLGRLLVFGASGALISWLCDQLRRAQARADAIGEERRLATELLEQTFAHRLEAEEAARERSDKLRAITDAVPALISYIDNTLHYRHVNHAYQRWFGPNPALIEGRHVREVLGDAAFEHVRPHMERALAGETVDYEARLPYAGQGPRWVHVNYTPERGEDGTVRGFVALVNDIAERKRDEQRAQDLHEITTQLAGTMTYEEVARVVVERVGAVLQAASVQVAVLGEDGQSLRIVQPARPQQEEARPLAQQPAWGEVIESRAPRYRGLPGAEGAASEQGGASACVPLMVGGRALGILELAWAVADTPARGDRQFIEALARECAQAMERARLYASEQEARARAEASDKAKEEFIAVLSHELRTPLTPVLTAARQLEANGAPPEKVRSLARMIRKNAELEARLIDDLLDVTRISRGKLTLRFEVIDVHTKLLDALRACEPELADKRIDLRTELTAERHHVRADQARFTQVIWNLLKNAVKFSDAEGRIVLRTREVDDRLVLEVRDEGIGIDAQLLPRLFHAFEQGSREVTRHFGGLGLGLAVSKTLVEAQGGTIAVESDGRGRGATFSVSMPLVQEEVGQELPAFERPSAHAAHAILVVEDDEDTSLLITEVLVESGYRVQVAGSVAAALQLAAREPFDLVLSDLGLPDGTGHELMRQLSARHRLRGIALSGYGRERDVAEAKAAGFVEHLTKPAHPDQLLQVLARVLAGPTGVELHASS